MASGLRWLGAIGGVVMRIKLDAEVRTKDGEKAGHVKKVIWDPARNEVISFVIATGGLLGHDVVVSKDVLERATLGGEQIVVDMTKDELHQLDRYEAGSYAEPPMGWTAPVPYDYPASSYLLMSVPMAIPMPPPEVHKAPARPAITKGTKVKGTGGETLGEVEEVRLDEATGELRSVTLRQSGVLGDGEVIEIPADHLEVGERELYVIEEAPKHLPR